MPVWFDRTKAMRKAHEDLERRYREILAGVTCPEHGDSPWLVKYGATMYQTEIEGCCSKARLLGLEAIQVEFGGVET